MAKWFLTLRSAFRAIRFADTLSHSSSLSRISLPYKRAVLAGAMALPILGAAYLWFLVDPQRTFYSALFHEGVTALTVLAAAVLAAAAYRNYHRSGDPFLRHVCLGFLGFIFVYTPHGLLTRLADHHATAFLMFGPAARLVLSIYLLIAVLHFYDLPDEPALRSKRFQWWPHLLSFTLLDLLLYSLTMSPTGLSLGNVTIAESLALTGTGIAVAVTVSQRIRASLMSFHLFALLLFVQACAAFLLGRPWSHLWWFAHFIGAAGVCVLGYAMVRVFETTNSFHTAYDEGELFEKLRARSQELEAANRQLTAFSDRISQSLTERRQAEEALKQAHEKLTGWVDELEERHREITLMSEMGNLLQSCISAREASTVIAESAKKLFPGDSGGLYMLNATQNLLEMDASWGQAPLGAAVFEANECWALRRGRAHQVEDLSSGLVCAHVSTPISFGCFCVPMMAQGQALGVFHLRLGAPLQTQADGPGKPKLNLAQTIAEQIALALANLNLRETLRHQSTRDPLTGLFNRRYMEASLERELCQAERTQDPLGLIMLDIDHFKRVNDTYSHEAGDTLLRALGTFLQSQVRGGDIACRYGGEEFTLILPAASAEATAERAEHVREAVTRLKVQYRDEPLGAVTFSLGIAVYPEHGTTPEALMRTADLALYRAKALGRNRVVVGEVAADPTHLP